MGPAGAVPPRQSMASLKPHPPLVFDGRTPFSTLFDDVFKSRHGAFDEARQVFVAGCRLDQRWSDRPRFCILELGFGLGVNFLATALAWRADPRRCAQLFFVSIEKHPLSRDDLQRALLALDAPPDLAKELVAQWPLALPGLHRLSFLDGAVVLLLGLGSAEHWLPRLQVRADAIFLDGFAPPKNPELWSPAVIRGVARHAYAGTTLATYSSAAAVRAALAEAGFEVSPQPGYGDKHRRLAAVYAPRWRTFRSPVPNAGPGERSAIVIGAGLAGCASAAALAGRGWQVTLLERASGAALGGSSQPVCADHLHLSPDDNHLARLTRHALLLSRTTRWTGRGSSQPSGRLVWASSGQAHEQQAAMLAALDWPSGFADAIDPDQASQRAGVRVPHGGLWLPLAGFDSPARLCEQWLADAATPAAIRWGVQVKRLQRRDEFWWALDELDQPMAKAAIVVLANAGDACRLGAMSSIDLRAIGGQTTLIRSERLRGLRCVLSADAFACPINADHAQIGATFDDSSGDRADPIADADNLDRLAGGLGCAMHDLGARIVRGYAGRRWATRDRLPVIGALPDEQSIAVQAAALLANDRLPIPRLPGAYGAFAFGARGLLWATLAAELVAASICGEPMPIETDLARSVDPARYVRRAIRDAESDPASATLRH